MLVFKSRTAKKNREELAEEISDKYDIPLDVVAHEVNSLFGLGKRILFGIACFLLFSAIVLMIYGNWYLTGN